ncbi:MAG: amidase [Pseudomonadota bacterium]
MTSLCNMPAHQLREQFAIGAVSAAEIAESCLERSAALKHLGAMVWQEPGEVRASAEAIDRAKRKGEPLGPLAGLPVAIKDLNDIAGAPTTFGSPLFKDNIATADDDVVANLRAAGAVLFGKTNVPEHGFGATTTSPLFGPARNPFDLARSAGASTGGGAVALASGMAPLATGSDFAGSLRTPASFCGLTGLRPSNGVVGTRRRGMAWSAFDVEGPMARCAADCKLLLAAMARGDPGDPLSASPHERLGKPATPVDLGGLRVAVSEDIGFAPVARSVRATFRDKLARFKQLFRELEAATPDLGAAERTFFALRGVGFVADFSPMESEFGHLLGPVVLDELKRARALTAEEIGAAHLEHTRVFRAALDFFEDYDVLITPAASVPPFAHEDDYPAAIDGEPMGGYLRWEAIAWGITLTQHPAVVIPCGLDPSGLPFGLQIVGPNRQDGYLLDVAHSLELAFAGDPELARPTPDIDGLLRRATETTIR